MDNPDIFEGKLNKYFAGWNLENTGGFDQYASVWEHFSYKLWVIRDLGVWLALQVEIYWALVHVNTIRKE